MATAEMYVQHPVYREREIRGCYWNEIRLSVGAEFLLRRQGEAGRQRGENWDAERRITDELSGQKTALAAKAPRRLGGF